MTAAFELIGCQVLEGCVLPVLLNGDEFPDHQILQADLLVATDHLTVKHCRSYTMLCIVDCRMKVMIHVQNKKNNEVCISIFRCTER
jgi:hypothetical protein